MTTEPVKPPVKGDKIRASWGASVANGINACAAEIASLRGPGRLESLRRMEASAPAAGLSPFACRFHVTEDDEDGKWEVYLPTGCLAVGESCDPINIPMSSVDGHDKDDERWFLLALDESEGSPYATRTETVKNAQGEDEEITVAVRRWEVVVHGKTRAKIDGVDSLQSNARHLMYVSAKRSRGSGENAPIAEELAKDKWGDEFSQTVGLIYVETKPDVLHSGRTITTRKYEASVKSAISVAARRETDRLALDNFDLVWYFEVDDETGELSCVDVYCVRNNLSVAGITVTGDAMTKVTDAGTIYAKLKTNPLNTSNGNVIEVVLDPQGIQSTSDDLTWLYLYKMDHNVVEADYRAQSLVNIQIFR